METKIKFYVAFFFVCMMIFPSLLWAVPNQVGKVSFTCGAVMAGPEGGELRFLGEGEPLYENDVITTSEKSFAIINMIDDSKITLRSDTVFAIEEYTFKERKGKALLRLFKGGLRVAAGLISKFNPRNGYSLHTPTAVAGVRGTEFDARLCEGDCAEESEKTEIREGIESLLPVVGRISRLKGDLVARSADGKERTVIKGGPVYEGDTLETGKGDIAVIVFRDNSRIALHGETTFKVEQYRYRGKRDDNIFFRLARGGIRVFSGLMAKRDARAFKLGTPTAVVGVRGTGYDVILQGTVTGSVQDQYSEKDFPQKEIEPLKAAPGKEPKENGMFIHVWEESIEVQSIHGIMVINQGQTLFLPDEGDPVFLPTIPIFMRDNPVPRPDGEIIDMEELFGTNELKENPPGLYVSVYDGHVTVENEKGIVELGRNEAAYVDPLTKVPVRLEKIPSFQQYDRFPRPEMFDKDRQGVMEFVVDGISGLEGQKDCTCEIQ
jgi:hypothetical protein